MANISIATDEYSYYIYCTRIAPNWNFNATRCAYLNKRHAETHKKLQDKWNEIQQNPKCSTFDNVNQIFDEIARSWIVFIVK